MRFSKENVESLRPQWGFETMVNLPFAVEALAKFGNVDVPDYILREVEGMVLLLANLTQQTTALGAVTSVLTWVQGRTTTSLYSAVKGYLEHLLVVPQSSGTPPWLDCLRDARVNWKMCLTNRAFKQISKLLGCLVMLGLCEVSNVSFSIGKFKVIAPELSEKHMTAMDMMDALFETIMFFVEGAYLSFQTGSITPMLVNDRAALALDEEYALICKWFSLVKNGNLHKFEGMDDHEFETRLNRLSGSLRNILPSVSGYDKKLVMDKFQHVLSMQNDYVTFKIASGVRHSPWAIELFGESAQGKTTLGNQIMDAIFTSQGMNASKEARCSHNAGDKFMSNWTTDKLAIIFDDVSNEKAQFVEKPPTRAILDVVNNQMYYAPKAELEAKGKCFVEPWVAVATTNKKDLDAGIYSNCPYSIQRRMTVLTVDVKEEFRKMVGGVFCGIDATKVREKYTIDGEYTPDVFDDIWNITIEEAVKPPDGKLHLIAKYEPLVWKGEKMINIGIEKCVQWAIESFDEHIKNQRALLESQRARESNITLCATDGCIHIKGKCPYHHCLPCEPHIGRETVAALARLYYRAGKMGDTVDKFYGERDKDLSAFIYKRGSKFLDEFRWITLLPSGVFDNPYFRRSLLWLHRDTIDFQYRSHMLGLVVVLGSVMCCTYTCCQSSLGLWCMLLEVYLGLAYGRALVTTVEDRFLKTMREENVSINHIVLKYRERYAKTICAACIGVAALYGLARAYRAYKRGAQDTHGSLEPQTREEVEQRDAEVNPWTGMPKRELPITDISKRMSGEQLGNVISKSLMYVTINAEDDNGMVNCLMLSTNLALMPNHYFDEFGEELDCTFRRANPDSSGGKFPTRIHIRQTVLLPNTDLRVCFIPNGGSFKNLLNMFPQDTMPSVPFKLFWRKKDGDMITARGKTVPGVVETCTQFSGGRYHGLTMNTFAGMCGAPLISDTPGSAILGVHLGGTAGTPVGVYGDITQSKLFDAISKLRSIEGVLLSGADSVFHTKQLGVQILKKDPLHKKSPLNYIPKNSQIVYHGSCVGRTVAKSDVKVTPISHHLVEVCDSPNIYCGPKMMPEWFGWQKCLENLAVPALPFHYNDLEWAIVDYKKDIIDVARKEIWSDARPLTDKENINGRRGIRFNDAMPKDTSKGFPRSGPKIEWMIELDPTEEWPSNWEFVPEIMEEIARIEALYAKGERAYPIAKACKKDEILTKEKCRVFYGNPVSLTFLVRKYYLPILRILQMNPLVSECAVGINAHGPEWEVFHQHVYHHGEDRLVGGDYGKYDQKLPSQLIFAAIRILNDIAAECNYSEKDLRVMEAMAADIVFAYIAFNGDLISLTEGTHISGNSLTVIINGICGSLNARVYYHASGGREPFRHDVSFMTYGDDNIGSVRSGCENFSIQGFSEFLENYGQVYTMPDKESALQPFLSPDEFEFLKRKSVWHESLNQHVGALIDKSIFKSLHCFLRGKNSEYTEDEACAINIDGALREWFNHGPDIYEMRRLQMCDVASRAGISHMCTGLALTYDERVEDWKSKYAPPLQEA